MQTLTRSSKTAEVDPKLKRWFYPLIVLLVCLPRAGRFPYQRRREIDQPPSLRSSEGLILRDFLSKLAFLCWTDISPATISACCVLNGPEGVEYGVTFNNRRTSELADLKGKISSILDMFHLSSASDDGEKTILRHVLSCCGKRVKCYLTALERHLADCIQACARDSEDDCECWYFFDPVSHQFRLHHMESIRLYIDDV